MKQISELEAILKTFFQWNNARLSCFTQIEDTHMTQQVRIEKLMALLVMGFVWAHKVGEWPAESTPIQWKVFRDGRRPQYAYFRYGLDFIRDIVLNLSQKYRQFKQIIQQLIPYQSTKKTPLC